MSTKVFYSAAVGVVLDPVTNKQKIFHGHTDDISCITLHPCGNIVATGQVSRKSYILVWSTQSVEQIAKVGHIRASGPTYESAVIEDNAKTRYYERGICAMAFSGSGKYLVAIGMDDHHSIAVWDWQNDRMLVSE